jgi:hypothetical protein
MEIEYKGIIYTIEKDEFESDDSFYERMWLVAKQEPVTQHDLEKAIYYSKLWSNYKLLGCSYSKEIDTEIRELDKKIYA